MEEMTMSSPQDSGTTSPTSGGQLEDAVTTFSDAVFEATQGLLKAQQELTRALLSSRAGQAQDETDDELADTDEADDELADTDEADDELADTDEANEELADTDESDDGPADPDGAGEQRSEPACAAAAPAQPTRAHADT